MAADVIPSEHALPETQKHAVIETDLFCDCGYNLHGQRTGLDDRLGFVTVRCPECGKWHPANQKSTANYVWLRRFAAFILLCWVLFLLGIFVAVTFAATGFAMAHTHEFSKTAVFEPGTDRLILTDYDYDPTGSPAGTAQYRFVYTYHDTGERVPLPREISPELNKMVAVSPDGARDYPTRTVPARSLPADYAGGQWGWQGPPPTWRSVVGSAGGSGAAGLVLGILQAAALWHLRWPAKLILPLTFLVFSIGLYFLFLTSTTSDYSDGTFAVVWIESLLTVQGSVVVFWILGLLIGRPIARFIVRLFVPPKPRQALAHLWFADGKDMPVNAA